MLSHNPEIIIGTPGRIWYFMENYKLGPSNLKNLRFIVWDEADKLVQNSSKFLSIDHTGSLSGNEIDRGMSGFLDGRSKKHGYFYKKKSNPQSFDPRPSSSPPRSKSRPILRRRGSSAPGCANWGNVETPKSW